MTDLSLNLFRLAYVQCANQRFNYIANVTTENRVIYHAYFAEYLNLQVNVVNTSFQSINIQLNVVITYLRCFNMLLNALIT